MTRDLKKIIDIKRALVYLKSPIGLMLMILTVSSCSEKRVPLEVKHYGVLREIMMEQKLEANADLREFRNQSHLYALGALQGLTGEILILDSRPLNGMASKGEFTFERNFENKASLLVSARVTKWKEVSLTLEQTDMSQLQIIVRDAAKQLSVNTEEPFPFLVKGQFEKVNWHVINASEAEVQNHDAYKKAGLAGESKKVDGQLLGFYSEKHEGVFTHHGSYLHIHYVDDAETEMGHVDELSLEGSIVLLIPDETRP